MANRTQHRVGGKEPNEHGVAAVEFAIILPVLVVILFGIMTFGVALSKLVTYVAAAREGARYAAVECQPDATQCTQALIQARVVNAAEGYPITPGPVTADRDCKTSPGMVVTVSWSQRIPLKIPLLPDLTKTVTIKGAFRCE